MPQLYLCGALQARRSNLAAVDRRGCSERKREVEVGGPYGWTGQLNGPALQAAPIVPTTLHAADPALPT